MKDELLLLLYHYAREVIPRLTEQRPLFPVKMQVGPSAVVYAGQVIADEKKLEESNLSDGYFFTDLFVHVNLQEKLTKQELEQVAIGVAGLVAYFVGMIGYAPFTVLLSGKLPQVFPQLLESAIVLVLRKIEASSRHIPIAVFNPFMGSFLLAEEGTLRELYVVPIEWHERLVTVIRQLPDWFHAETKQ